LTTSVAKLRALKRLMDDFPHYAENCLKIKDKAGSIVSLCLNKAQLYVHERLEEQRQRTGRVRALILKARQQGFSTYIGGRFYHRTSLNKGMQTFILTHEQDATDNLFGMVERYHANTPLKPSTGAANAKELFFNILDSGYSVGTAGSKAVGRSKTIQQFHGSETAFWPNAKAHFAGVVQAVPDLPGTEIVLESTANGVGGEFHERWQKAEAGIGDYIAIFVPWFWADEYSRPVPDGFKLSMHKKSEGELSEAEYAEAYGLTLEQMAWRRAKEEELGPVMFKQEYPATASEAFQTTGHDSFISAEVVLTARKSTKEAIGPLVVGVDPSRFGDDRFSIAWRRGRKLIKVESRSKIGTTEAVGWLKQIIDNDQPAKMFMDTGGGGDRIFDILESYGEPYDKVITLVAFGGSPQEPVEYLKDGSKRAGPKNRRAEIWKRSKDWLEQEGGADIPDQDSLQTDACGPGYHYDLTTQQLILESKEHMRDVRHVRSPDEWDAVALTFAEPVKEPKAAAVKAKVSTVQSGSYGWMDI
jgi:hypothetical protein